MKFTIETVSKMTGIPAPSLRNWEKRYGFPNPERTLGGHRYYSDSDVEFLKQAVVWIEEGQSLNAIAQLYQQKSGILTNASREIMDDVSYRVQLISEALLQFDQLATLQHYATLSAKLSVEQLFERVFEALLGRFERDLQEEKITVAQEHFASAFMRMKLSSFLALDFPPTQKSKILLATLAGERHENGLMLLSAHLKFRGYPVFYLGIELPLEDLKAVQRELKPDVICLFSEHNQPLMKDYRDLSSLKVPVCLVGPSRSSSEGKALTNSGKVHFCQKTSSAEIAHFVEMICQSKLSTK